jgi:hypothetical protein
MAGPVRQVLKGREEKVRSASRMLSWRDLVGPDELTRLWPPDGEVDLGFARNLAARIAGGFRRPGEGAELPAGVRVMLTIPAIGVPFLRVIAEVAWLLNHKILVRLEGQADPRFEVCPSAP